MGPRVAVPVDLVAYFEVPEEPTKGRYDAGHSCRRGDFQCMVHASGRLPGLVMRAGVDRARTVRERGLNGPSAEAMAFVLDRPARPRYCDGC